MPCSCQSRPSVDAHRRTTPERSSPRLRSPGPPVAISRNSIGPGPVNGGSPGGGAAEGAPTSDRRSSTNGSRGPTRRRSPSPRADCADRGGLADQLLAPHPLFVRSLVADQEHAVGCRVQPPECGIELALEQPVGRKPLPLDAVSGLPEGPVVRVSVVLEASREPAAAESSATSPIAPFLNPASADPNAVQARPSFEVQMAARPDSLPTATKPSAVARTAASCGAPGLDGSNGTRSQVSPSAEYQTACSSTTQHVSPNSTMPRGPAANRMISEVSSGPTPTSIGTVRHVSPVSDRKIAARSLNWFRPGVFTRPNATSRDCHSTTASIRVAVGESPNGAATRDQRTSAPGPLTAAEAVGTTGRQSASPAARTAERPRRPSVRATQG